MVPDEPHISGAVGDDAGLLEFVQELHVLVQLSEVLAPRRLTRDVPQRV